ncbi:Tripartite-type tricarboxylate transporter, receptor component TctC [Polaromonas sp. OV174]|uniref:Bug family tripartite tricarboxylate transporter substrate binding protein n=1 Tax=Polaromonas sp. OV174 TaxID=1855300 RepID=UPI0008E7F56A|nr:tripartite tricarboxylate transporter substrate binding protein [Polaromonas sp. OV174]SFC53328.1 Tripartite-type tricarboxylate transporter, receptor component TctC [Polaromonas sp. OV174]
MLNRPLSVRRRNALALMCAGLAAALPSVARAADPEWPNAKPITWLVGFAPGGSADVLTRAVARQLSEKTGRPVVVDNRPGASGVLALHQAAKAAPDGYTLITLPGPILFAQQVPEVGKELQAVAMLAQGPMVLVGPASTAAPDLQALVKAIRQSPKDWSYASSGTGTSQHLAGELFNQVAGIQATHIPYKGGGQAIADVVGGQVPLAILGASPVLPHVQSGKLKAYAVTTRYRLETMPQVPTFQEAGFKDYEASQWFAVGVPVGTPEAYVQRLNGWFNAIVGSPALQDVLRASGTVKGGGTAQETARFISGDNQKWKKLAQQVKLKFD